MNYFIKRGDQEYGPYTLAALQQYVAQGNISQQDLARSEAMTDWAPVASVMGNVTVPTATTGFGATTGAALPDSLPPGLHWGVLVALGIVTFGIFWVIWLFVQAAWVRKVRPQSRALYYLIGYLVAAFGSGFLAEVVPGISLLLNLGGIVLYILAIFGIRSDIEEFYGTINPIGISLSGVMTFFFNAAYFQYHLRDIREEMENHILVRGAAAS